MIASLWRVDDQATAALMALFYDQLWRHGKSPVDALRHAQLALYQHPDLAEKLDRARGTPDFDKLVQRPVAGADSGKEQGTKARAPVRQWAAFVLSARDNETMRASHRGTTQPARGRTRVLGGDVRCRGAGGKRREQDPAPSSPPGDATPLSAVLHLRIDDVSNPRRRNVRLDQAKALPLKAGDRFRIEARINRPAYLYLVWIGCDGKVGPIYPWAPASGSYAPLRNGNSRVSSFRRRPIRSGRSPPETRGSRPWCCSSAKKARYRGERSSNSPISLLARLSAAPVLLKEAVWLENGREITLDRQDRAAPAQRPARATIRFFGFAGSCRRRSNRWATITRHSCFRIREEIDGTHRPAPSCTSTGVFFLVRGSITISLRVGPLLRTISSRVLG